MKHLIKMIDETQAAMNRVPEDKKAVLMDSMAHLMRKVAEHAATFHDIPENFNERIYPSLTGQLAAAEKRTEKAADDIMTATETMMGALSDIQGSGKEKIQDGINRIFEACNFQDLVAQHLNEIKILADALQKDMADLSNAMGESDGSQQPQRKKSEERPDAHLLNGPAVNF